MSRLNILSRSMLGAFPRPEPEAPVAIYPEPPPFPKDVKQNLVQLLQLFSLKLDVVLQDTQQAIPARLYDECLRHKLDMQNYRRMPD